MYKKREYDIALSFADEDREYVDKVARRLKNLNIEVYYDRFEEANLWGKDLYTYLTEIYKDKAEFTIIFISKHYVKQLWTNHQRQAMQARAFEETKEYILPVRFDETEIEGLPKTIQAISAQEKDPQELVDLILQKLNNESSIGFNINNRCHNHSFDKIEHIVPEKLNYPVLFQPFIMAGGLGTRVIHLSPTNVPKQFWRIYGRASMLQDAILRIVNYWDNERTGLPVVISINKIKDKINTQVSELNISKYFQNKNVNISSWFEPDRKGTALAILYSLIKSYHEEKIFDDSVLGFFPADQNIYLNEEDSYSNETAHKRFKNSLRKAFLDAYKGNSVILLGSEIYKGKDEYSNGSRYGWIKVTGEDYYNTRNVAFFVEKPSKEEIEEMIKEGSHNWLWNTGTFIIQAQLLKKIFKKYLPELNNAIENNDLSLLEEAYSKLKKSVMFDDILEEISKSTNSNEASIKVVTVKYAWEDLGHTDTIRDHYLRTQWRWKVDAQNKNKKEIDSSNNVFEVELNDLNDNDVTYLVYQSKNSQKIQIAKLSNTE